MNKQKRTSLLILWISLSLLSMAACSKEEKYIGTYICQEGSSPEHTGLYIELRPGGEGIRRVRGEEVSFSWVAKGREIRVHTKSGGVIVGRLEKGQLVVRFPGPKIVRLKKIK